MKTSTRAGCVQEAPTEYSGREFKRGVGRDNGVGVELDLNLT